MTTISNFLQTNFLLSQPSSQAERPFWLIDSTRNHHPQTLIKAMISKCISDKKYAFR